MQITFNPADCDEAQHVLAIIGAFHPETVAAAPAAPAEKPAAKPAKGKGSGAAPPAGDVDFNAVRTATSNLINAKGRDVAKALLTEHGATAGVSSLPEASWAGYVKAAEAAVE